MGLITIEEKIKHFLLTTFNVDLNEKSDTIMIDGIVLPNYYHKSVVHVDSIEEICERVEFCRILYKLFSGNYKNTHLSFYETESSYIKPGDIVFDCGGNLGIFAAYAAAKGAKVYCFEPGTLIRHYLRETQKLYPENIIIVPFGVGDKSEFNTLIQFDNPAASRVSNSIFGIDHKILYKEKIQIVSLDDFCKKTNIVPDFIKMDIESYEIQALMGSQEIIKEFHPALSVVFHFDNLDKIKTIEKQWSENGYNFYYLKKDFFDPILIGVYND